MVVTMVIVAHALLMHIFTLFSVGEILNKVYELVWTNPRSSKPNVLDCDIVVIEFEFQYHYYLQFREVPVV